MKKEDQPFSKIPDMPNSQTFDDLTGLSKEEIINRLEETQTENILLKEKLAAQQIHILHSAVLAANSPDSLLIQNRDLIYTQVINSSAFFPIDQLLGKNDSVLFSSSDATRISRLKKRILEDGVENREEIQRINGNETRHFLLHFLPWHSQSGERIGLITYARDITETKRAESGLYEQLVGEKILAEITEQFLQAEIARSNEQIPAALKTMAEYLLADIGFVRFIDPVTQTIQSGFEWKNPTTVVNDLPSLGIPFDQLELTRNQLEKNKPIFVPEVFAIPDKGELEKEVLRKIGLNSLVLYPLIIFNELRGYVGFGAKKAYSFWSEREKGLLGVFQSTIIHVLERTEREITLRESRELYQKLLELSPNAIYLIQGEKLLYTNPSGAHLAGYSNPGVIAGTKYVDIFATEIIEKFRKQIPPDIEENQVIHGEISIRTSDKGKTYVEFNTIKLKIKDERAYLIIGVNITHRKRIEKEFEENSKFLNEILTISPLAVFVFDREKDVFTYHNPATNKMLGLSNDRLNTLGKHQIINMVHPDDLDKARRYSEELARLQPGKVLEGEYRWIRPDGEIRWLHSYQIVLSRNPNQTTNQSLTILQDVSEIKKAQKDLQQSEDQYHRLVEDVPGIVYQALFDEAYTTVFLSDFYTKLTGIDKNDLIGNSVSTWVDQIHPDDRARLFSEMDRSIATLSPFEVEYRLRKADGTFLWVTDSGRIIFNNEKKPLYINGIVTDITSRKRDYEAMRLLSQDNLKLLAQARRDSETKTLLLNEVNHRVKNNIASIIGLLELESQREIQPGVDYQTILSDIKNRITGLATVHDILSSNLWAPVEIELFIRKVIESAASSSPLGRKIAISIICPDQNIWINSRQATTLALIINELTTNSIRHAFSRRNGGQITATIQRDPHISSQILIRFADNGPGWPSEILDGSGGNVGMQVIRLSAASPLYGSIQFENDNGAVAIITFNLAQQQKSTKRLD